MLVDNKSFESSYFFGKYLMHFSSVTNYIGLNPSRFDKIQLSIHSVKL